MNRQAARKRGKQGDITRIVYSIGMMKKALVRSSNELHRKFKVTGPQLGALRTVDRFPELSLSELSERMYLHVSTVSEIVDRLVAGKYLTRKRGIDDRRMVFLSISRKGKSVIRKAPTPEFGLMVRALEKMSVKDLRQLRTTIEKVLQMMEIGTGNGKALRERSSVTDGRFD